MADMQSDATHQTPAAPRVGASDEASPLAGNRPGRRNFSSPGQRHLPCSVRWSERRRGFYGLAARNVTEVPCPTAISPIRSRRFCLSSTARLCASSALGLCNSARPTPVGRAGPRALRVAGGPADAALGRPGAGAGFLALAALDVLHPPGQSLRAHLAGRRSRGLGLSAMASRRPKYLLLSALTALGIGCRLASAPYFLVLWLAALCDGGLPSVRQALRAVAELVGLVAVVFLPFWLLAPKA